MSNTPPFHDASPIIEAFGIAGQVVADFDAFRAHYEASLAELRQEVDEIKRTPERRRWLTRQEAAEYISAHPTTLDNYRHLGFIPTHRLPGGDPRFDPDELDEFLRTGKSVRDE